MTELCSTVAGSKAALAPLLASRSLEEGDEDPHYFLKEETPHAGNFWVRRRLVSKIWFMSLPLGGEGRVRSTKHHCVHVDRAPRGPRAAPNPHCCWGIKAGPWLSTSSSMEGSGDPDTDPRLNLIYLDWGRLGHWHKFTWEVALRSCARDGGPAGTVPSSTGNASLQATTRRSFWVSLSEDSEVREKSHVQGQLVFVF